LISGLPQAAHDLFAHTVRLAQQHPQRITAAVAALLLGGSGLTFAVANLGPDAASLPQHTVVEAVTPLPLATKADAIQAQALRLYRSDVTRSTDTAEILLKRLGAFDPQAAAFLRSNTLVQQNLMGRAGRNVTLEAGENHTVIALTARWSPEDDGMFKRLTVRKTDTGFSAQLETLPMSATARLAGGTISSSLFAATDDANIPDSIAVQMAEIFSGDIDFHRALRKGDRFSVVYETLEGDGEPLRAGRVLSAEFVNAGKAHQAMWFQEPTAASSTGSTATHTQTKGGYYTLAGESLRRSYLAAPLEFSRVTSGFKMRFHPILQTWRAHTGVDYAAPTGTPVRTVGDGMVSFAGVQSGYGNVVIVQHRSGHATVYAHLSRIQVKVGERVSQGQFIGNVGSTGWATGPHLHFEYRINGQYQDPQTMLAQSETIPVAPALKPQFDRLAAQARLSLDAAAQMHLSSAQ
jgi:murein DD-endopeptidase MepM/ murein hydrolase activator NlpD